MTGAVGVVVELYSATGDMDMFIAIEEMLIADKKLELVVEFKVIEIDFFLVVYWAIGFFAAIVESCFVAVDNDASIVC